MYSYEQRKQAVELYLKYQSWAAVIHKLGYPNRGTLRQWYKIYVSKEQFPKKRVEKFSEEQIKAAVDHYMEYGKCVSRTIRLLGYPSRSTLKRWLYKHVPEYIKPCRTSKTLVHLSQRQKIEAAIDFRTRECSADKIAKKHGVSRFSLYHWDSQLFGEGRADIMVNKKPVPTIDPHNIIDQLKEEISILSKESAELQKRNYRLRLENDVLEKAAEILKKGQGITLQTLTNHEKTMVIDALREQHRLKELLSVFHLAKSSYCYQKIGLRKVDKYSDVRELVHRSFSRSGGCYGYRRIYTDIKNLGTTLSEKVVRRLMKEENLAVIHIKKAKYNSYIGEISPAVKNIIQRNFYADKPNLKWLTDITEFSIPSGKIYLSPVIDCFDGLPISWSIGTHPNAKLVETMLDGAIQTLKQNEKPIIHTDRGGHYRWPGWINRMNQAGLTRSMSKKGCSPDNSACEGFFGRVKNEMFYGREWKGVTISDFIDNLDHYLHWYAEERIKISLGGMSPLQYRKSLGLAV